MARTHQPQRPIDTNAIKQAVVQLQQLFGAGQVLPTNVMPENPAMNTALNAAAYLPNQIYGQGIVAPVNDATHNAMNLMQGQQPVPYDQLQSGATKLGYQAGAAINPTQGVPQDLPTAGANTMQGVSPALHALLIKNILSTAAKGKDLIDAYKAAGEAGKPKEWNMASIRALQQQSQQAVQGLQEQIQAARSLLQHTPR